MRLAVARVRTAVRVYIRGGSCCCEHDCREILREARGETNIKNYGGREKMIQTYQGYFQEDGRFIADNMIVRIPPHRRVILNIMEDKIIMQNETDKKEIEERRAMIKSLKGCMTGYEVNLNQVREGR